jgi:hypothetical protein
MKTKLCGLLSTGIILHHDSARPHTARATAATIEDLHFECLPHPPYSPDLAPSDYHMFGPQEFSHFVSIGELVLSVGEIM